METETIVTDKEFYKYISSVVAESLSASPEKSSSFLEICFEWWKNAKNVSWKVLREFVQRELSEQGKPSFSNSAKKVEGEQPLLLDTNEIKLKITPTEWNTFSVRRIGRVQTLVVSFANGTRKALSTRELQNDVVQKTFVRITLVNSDDLEPVNFREPLLHAVEDLNQVQEQQGTIRSTFQKRANGDLKCVFKFKTFGSPTELDSVTTQERQLKKVDSMFFCLRCSLHTKDSEICFVYSAPFKIIHPQHTFDEHIETPAITSISPTSGPVEYDGTEVTIRGSFKFWPTLGVYFVLPNSAYKFALPNELIEPGILTCCAPREDEPKSVEVVVCYGDYSTSRLKSSASTKKTSIKGYFTYFKESVQRPNIRKSQDISYQFEQGFLDSFDLKQLNNLHCGWTWLHLAIAYGRYDIVETLLDKGALVDTKDEREGSTPLYWSVLHEQYEIAELLLKKGANPNKTDKYGFSCVIIASARGAHSLLESLTQHGGDVNLSNEYGETALHYAVACGQLETVRLLIHKYNALFLRDNDLKTPIDWIELIEEESVKMEMKSILESGSVSSSSAPIPTLPSQPSKQKRKVEVLTEYAKKPKIQADNTAPSPGKPLFDAPLAPMRLSEPSPSLPSIQTLVNTAFPEQTRLREFSTLPHLPLSQQLVNQPFRTSLPPQSQYTLPVSVPSPVSVPVPSPRVYQPYTQPHPIPVTRSTSQSSSYYISTSHTSALLSSQERAMWQMASPKQTVSSTIQQISPPLTSHTIPTEKPQRTVPAAHPPMMPDDIKQQTSVTSKPLQQPTQTTELSTTQTTAKAPAPRPLEEPTGRFTLLAQPNETQRKSYANESRYLLPNPLVICQRTGLDPSLPSIRDGQVTVSLVYKDGSELPAHKQGILDSLGNMTRPLDSENSASFSLRVLETSIGNMFRLMFTVSYRVEGNDTYEKEDIISKPFVVCSNRKKQMKELLQMQNSEAKSDFVE